jgi:hypothetical protein
MARDSAARYSMETAASFTIYPKSSLDGQLVRNCNIRKYKLSRIPNIHNSNDFGKELCKLYSSLTKHYNYVRAHHRLKLLIYWLRPTKSCTFLLFVWIYRGAVSIGYLKFAVVVILVLLGLPVLLDIWKSGAAVSARVAV